MMAQNSSYLHTPWLCADVVRDCANWRYDMPLVDNPTLPLVSDERSCPAPALSLAPRPGPGRSPGSLCPWLFGGDTPGVAPIGSVGHPVRTRLATGVCHSSDMIRWSRVLLSRTLDAARSY